MPTIIKGKPQWVSGKVGVKAKTIKRDKEGYYIMIKGSID